MKVRCPTFRFVKRGYLQDYKFAYDGHSTSRDGPVANVRKNNGSQVWGGIFEIDEKCRRVLDVSEGIAKGSYYYDNLSIVDDYAEATICLIYIGSGKRNNGTPKEPYRQIVIRGASDCDLPDDYIRNSL